MVEMLYGYRNSGGKPRTYCRCVGIDKKEYIIRSDALTTGATKHIAGAMSSTNDLVGKRFGKLTVLYPTNKRESNGSIIWHCRCDCGNECDVNSSNLLRDHTRSCGCAHQSKWEEFIKEYLEIKKIDYVEQKRFQDCRNKKGTDMLPFDFYLPKIYKIIEYDGQHHFEPINAWGGEEKFKKIQENDNIKNLYCENNGIELLRIPFTKTKKEICEMIDDFLSPAEITP